MKLGGIILIILAIGLVALIFIPSVPTKPNTATIIELTQNNGLYVASPNVANIANSLKESSDVETTRNVVEWVANNINYDFNEENALACDNSTAQDIIDSGEGICSTMSRVAITLLRSEGIPAKPMTGCFSPRAYCQLFAILPSGKEIPANSLQIGDKIYTGGEAHTWIQVWTEERGWVYAEPTTGYLFSTDCYNYLEYADNPEDICTISPIFYLSQCKK